MDVREKLVEMIEKASYECDEGTRDLYDKREVADGIADFLIAHGVTVQDWISVEDKLPEVVSIHKGYRSTVKKSIRVLCVCVQKSGKTMVKEGYCEWYNDYQEPRWQIPGTIDEVTHWQYLPQPPKGE